MHRVKIHLRPGAGTEVRVDFGTQRRTPKTSAAWLGAVAKENRLPDEPGSGL